MKRFFLLFFSFIFINANASDPARYVWSVGFAMDCDYVPFRTLPQDYETYPPRSYIAPERYIHDVKKRSVIWVQEFQVKAFYHDVLPYIKKPFVLVISDGDESFPSDYRKEFSVDRLIADPRVIHIFAQNANEKHAKISHIPIGLDFHSITRKGGWFGEPQQSIKEQEVVLEQILTTLPPTHIRKKRVFVDFHLCGERGAQHGESRMSIYNRICPRDFIDTLSHYLPRRELWAMKGQYAFTVSPHGNGLDSHRTWEDLVLGCIVIVKSSPLDPLYEGLPVVILKDWSELTEENLDKWLVQYGDAFTNPTYREKLTHSYWMNKIRKKTKG